MNEAHFFNGRLSKWSATIKWLATVAISIWGGGSVYYLFGAPDTALFQAFGAVGVGALIAHYSFIRSTFRFRRLCLEQNRSSQIALVYDLTRCSSDKLSGELLNLQKLTQSLEDLMVEEDRSVFKEILLVGLATLQWGFGDRVVGVLCNLKGVSC
ncbi:hypothetical protein [uncultured Pelagimonas sp.]|uniref:hypothetical protein n=1 Tax=uncultured Pelagimonas sp. TaxID=1618102 RepID=UPI00261A86C7|nr:hypothetical protein [uncultured Pelagimonas sp.]